MIKFTQVEIVGAIIAFTIGGVLIFFLSKRWEYNFKMLLTFWSIKLFLSFFYVYLFSEFYFPGQGIQGDSYNFLFDSQQLNKVAYESPTTYAQLLTGTSNEKEIVSSGLLSQTQIWDAGRNGDWINDNRLIIKINSLVHFVSFNNVYVHAIFMSFLAFLGILFMHRTFQSYVHYKIIFLTTLFLLPTIGFWGSGLTKEALLIFAMGLFFICLKKLLNEKIKVTYIIYFTIAISILLFNKPYAGIVIIGLSLILIYGKMISWKKIGLIVSSAIILLSIVLLCIAPEKINLVHKISTRQKDMINLAKGGVFFITDSSFCAFDAKYANNFDTLNNKIQVLVNTPGEYKLFGEKQFNEFSINASDKWYDLYLMINPSSSYFEISEINFIPLNLIKTLPEVLFNSLLRPFPFDNGSNFKWIIFLQNLGLLALLIFGILRTKNLAPKQVYLYYYLIISALLIILLIGWTTPVFGAMARYKIPAEILIIIASFISIKPKKTI